MPACRSPGRNGAGLSSFQGVPVTLEGDLATTTWTTNQAAEAAHVPPGRIRIWAHRGKLTAVNPRSARPRYRALDVLRVEAEMRRSAVQRTAA
jgi:hypothetical protein